jgi:hypothetical protein
MISDPAQRERRTPPARRCSSSALVGSVAAATLARAFRMRVIGLRRNTAAAAGVVDEVFGPERLHEALARADYVALTCPLTARNRGVDRPAGA